MFAAFIVVIVAFMAFVNLAGLIPAEPWFILNYGAQIMGNILITPYPPRATMSELGVSKGSFGNADLPIVSFRPTVTESLATITLYFTITTIAGLIIFKRKEFT